MFREQAHTMHHKIVETFHKYIQKVGMQGKFVKESEIKLEDVEN